MKQVLFLPFESVENGTIRAEQFTPLNDMRIPEGCTHVIIQAGIASIDFKGDVRSCCFWKTNWYSWRNWRFWATAAQRPDELGTDLYFISIQFIQELNGVDYPFKNNQYNVLNLYKVEETPEDMTHGYIKKSPNLMTITERVKAPTPKFFKLYNSRSIGSGYRWCYFGITGCYLQLA